MPQGTNAKDLARQLASLKLDLETTKHQFRAQHAHLAHATKHLARAIVRLGQPTTKRVKSENPRA